MRHYAVKEQQLLATLNREIMRLQRRYVKNSDKTIDSCIALIEEKMSISALKALPASEETTAKLKEIADSLSEYAQDIGGIVNAQLDVSVISPIYSNAHAIYEELKEEYLILYKYTVFADYLRHCNNLFIKRQKIPAETLAIEDCTQRIAEDLRI
jgi:hypothetical protein